MRRLDATLAVGVTLTIALLGFAGTTAADPASCGPGQQPSFVFGFATLKEEVGEAMGEPLECEHANPGNGDALQRTTTGLAFYRRSTNTPTFTNGSEHWALTPEGVVYWVGEAIDPPGVIVPTPTPRPLTPTPVPTATPTQVPPTAVPSVPGPSYKGQRPVKCQEVVGSDQTRRVYLCQYPDQSVAVWPSAIDNTLLFYAEPGDKLTPTSAGLAFLLALTGGGGVSLGSNAEAVTLVKRLDPLRDIYLVQRSLLQGSQSYILELGVGCLMAPYAVGRTVYVDSPSGFFAGIGARLILPDNAGSCMILSNSRL